MLTSYPLLPQWLLDIFSNPDFISDIKETSKDDSDKSNIQYMLDRPDIAVIDFDEVKKNILNGHLRSNDAFFAVLDQDGHEDIIWVEFKNGSLTDGNGTIRPEKALELNQKIYDSVNTFLYYISNSSTPEAAQIKNDPWNYLKEHSHYYLVYNEHKNMSRTSWRQRMNNRSTPRSAVPAPCLKGFEKIRNHFAGYLHKSLTACTPNDFEVYLNSILTT